MKEKELIDEYKTIVKELQDKEIIFRYEKNEHLKIEIQNEIEKLNKRKTELIDLLTSCEDKFVTRKKVETLRALLFRLREIALNENKFGYPLSRNQGLIINSYIYIKIAKDIADILNLENGFGISDYYLEKEGDFDNTLLHKAIDDFIQELNTKKINNYLELESVILKWTRCITSIDENCGKYF